MVKYIEHKQFKFTIFFTAHNETDYGKQKSTDTALQGKESRGAHSRRDKGSLLGQFCDLLRL